MLTVTQLAKKFDISRATVLYYEREGLLQPALRSDNGYRWYSKAEIDRMRSIMAYRSYGVPVATLADLINRKDDVTQEHILREQFSALEREIQKLRQQQTAIMGFLQQPNLLEEPMVTKERWVEIMRASGLNDQDMQSWHKQFEKMEPDAHQEFLESLSISADEIEKIRNWSKN